jgi:hypothetical protein
MAQEIVCIDCGNSFEFTDGEEKFYQEKGLVPPKRCSKCRLKKRAERESGSGESSHRPPKFSKPFKKY